MLRTSNIDATFAKLLFDTRGMQITEKCKLYHSMSTITTVLCHILIVLYCRGCVGSDGTSRILYSRSAAGVAPVLAQTVTSSSSKRREPSSSLKSPLHKLVGEAPKRNDLGQGEDGGEGRGHGGKISANCETFLRELWVSPQWVRVVPSDALPVQSPRRRTWLKIWRPGEHCMKSF